MTAVDAKAFTNAMRQVASSVTVVTTGGPAGQAGATVSAFASVSADPPSVLVCLYSGSRIARAVTGNEVFCVNILPEDAARTARIFAGLTGAASGSRFETVANQQSPSGPLLAGATALNCCLEKTLVHATHTVAIGRVTSIRNAAVRPLTYLDGAFQCVRPPQIETGDQGCQ